MCSGFITSPIPTWSIRRRARSPPRSTSCTGLRGPHPARHQPGDGSRRGRVVGVQRRRHPDHLPPAPGSQVQRRLAADGGELPLRRRAHLRPGDRRRVPVHPLRDRRLRGVRGARRRRGRQAQEYTPEEYDAAKAALGAKALDDLTLQLDLTNPAPYFHTIAYALGLLPGQEGDRGERPRQLVEDAPRTTSATDRSRSPASTKIRSGRSPPTTTTGRGGRSSTASSIVYVEDAAVALEAYRAGDLDIVQLAIGPDPGSEGRPRTVAGLRDLPAGRQPVPGHEPHHGAVQRQEGAGGLRLRHRPRDPLRGAPLRRLHADPLLDPGGASRRHRNRQVRLRSRGR